MANNVIIQVVGGSKQVHDSVFTVADCRKKVGLGTQYKGQIGGVPANDSDPVAEGNYVTFSEAVKGALVVVAGIRV